MLETRSTTRSPAVVGGDGRSGGSGAAETPGRPGPIACTALLQARTAARIVAATRRRTAYRRCRALCDDIVERVSALSMARHTPVASRLAGQVRADADAILRHVSRLSGCDGGRHAGAGTTLTVVRSEAGVEALAEELSGELLDAQSGWERARRQSVALAMSLRVSVHAMTEAYSSTGR
jgi:hypothetical protein